LPIAKFFRKPAFLAGLASIFAAIGCGSSGNVIAHQTGSYSNASFKGSYVYQMHGFVVSSTGSLSPYREVGVITADGNGNITAGIDNANVQGTGAPASQSTSLTGTYSIANDGTGQLLLNATALGTLLSSSQITFAVTLASSSTANLMEADFFINGSGVANLQDSTAATSTPTGPFVFRLHDDANAQAASESEVGLLNISAGSVTGAADEGLVSSANSLTISSGNITAPNSSGIGTITFTDSSSVTTSLIYCVVNSSKFVFLPATAGVVGSGSAEAQSGTVSSGLSGTYAFGSRGDDLSSGVGGVATVGEFTASGAAISSGALDAMDDGNYAGAVTFTGTAAASPSAQGRVAATLSAGPTMVLWLVSPARAFFLFENEGAAEDGTADLQTGSSFSAATITGQYALVMDGLDFVNGQALSRIGTLQFDGSSKITLVELSNGSGTGSGAQNPGTLGGNYQVGGSGRITTQITGTNGSGPDMVMYAVSSSQAYALQTDSGENTSGTIQLQQ
jgi:hypothetical protein